MPTFCIVDKNKKKIFVQKVHFADHTFSVVKCTSCGLCYVDCEDGKLEKILSEYYRGSYQKEFWSKKIPFENLRRKLSQILLIFYSYADSQRLFLEKNLRKKPESILDLGCGTGLFLQWLEKKKYNVEGVEPDPVRAAIAQKRLHGKITVGSIEEKKNSAEVISSLHVLEHLVRPDILLKKFSKWYPKSTLFLEIPNCESEKTLQESLQEPHIYHFTPRTIRKILENAGWEILALETCGEEITYSKQLQWLFLNKNVAPQLEKGKAIRLLARIKTNEEIKKKVNKK